MPHALPVPTSHSARRGGIRNTWGAWAGRRATGIVGAMHRSRLFASLHGALVVAVSTFALAGPASAEVRTFTGAVDNDWHVADNWRPRGVPTSQDDAVIPAGRTPI